mgnify:CR=1 FL=1
MKKSFILFVFLLCSIVVVAQKKSITGIITDTAGEAVIGASIVEVGTTNGTVSDVDGNFTLSVSDNASIQVSFIGFSSQTLSVQGKMNFKIILKEDSELLQEVVVTGYGGKVSRAKLTNSISTVSPQILEKGIYTNPSQALSGSVPGLKVSLTSGNPTSSPKVILRGGTEFDGSGGPLVIVDGQLRDNFDDINPQDIASMDVLKDAGATAIYGARASNGVILITTKRGKEGKPVVSAVILILIILGCLGAELIMTKDPAYMDLLNYNKAPDREFLFGTDTMGRDIFSMIWYGGRISILIGGLATVISTFIAVVVGAFSGVAPAWLDELIMRFTEIFLSIPTLLLVILLQAIMGEANILSLSFVIGVTSWTSIAKVVRTEVRQIRNSEYIIAARCMGAGFFRILWKHLVPNFFSSIMFMVVMNVRTAMISEATLSFMGIGLPIEVITWGSMLSLSDKALMTGSWWIILIPGLFLITTVLCLTNIGNACREQTNRKESNF